MEIARDVKTFKIEELSAKQGVWDNDKNTIHLPRQVTKRVLKTFEN